MASLHLERLIPHLLSTSQFSHVMTDRISGDFEVQWCHLFWLGRDSDSISENFKTSVNFIRFSGSENSLLVVSLIFVEHSSIFPPDGRWNSRRFLGLVRLFEIS